MSNKHGNANNNYDESTDLSKHMNILVLMCDHHRYDALSCLGNPLARTPNLDELSSQSIRSNNCFTQSPVCAPARYSLATGLHVHAHGVLTNKHMAYLGLVTIAHLLQPLSYRRYNIGHMHWKDPSMDTGYEPWITHKAWRDAMPKHVLKRYAWERQNITRRTTGGPSPRTCEQYSGYYVAKNAIAQIEDAVRNGERFLCWAAFSEPHPPFYPPKDLYEMFDQSKIELPPQAPIDAPFPHDYILNKRREWAHFTDVEVRQILAGYYGMIALVDGYCGMILDALKRLDIHEQTIVIWTVDHGDQMWEHELFLKFCMYEGSVRVPLLINMPGNATAVRNELVEHVDLVPTICELVGVDCPDTVQGRSLVPLLGQDDPPCDWRGAVFSQIGNIQMIRTKEWKLNVYDGQPGELFDLQNDPNEFYNLVENPQCADTMQVLLAELKDWETRNGPPCLVRRREHAQS